jgi:hypothetical protein
MHKFGQDLVLSPLPKFKHCSNLGINIENSNLSKKGSVPLACALLQFHNLSLLELSSTSKATQIFEYLTCELSYFIDSKDPSAGYRLDLLKNGLFKQTPSLTCHRNKKGQTAILGS